MNAAAAKAKMIAKIQNLTTDQLIAGVVAIGSGIVATEERIVRAFLIEEFIAREGVEAGDMLMDQVGL